MSKDNWQELTFTERLQPRECTLREVRALYHDASAEQYNEAKGFGIERIEDIPCVYPQLP